jgi:uncharacterized membrane protein YqjE
LATEPTDQQQHIAAAISEVSERMTVLVREEIELAKAELTVKVTKLVKGAVVGLAAGIFLLLALMFALHGVAWLLYWVLPFPSGTFFWGFFVLAALLVLLAALAGFIAYKAVRAGTPPTPTMAIDEAKKIRATVSSGASGSEVRR